MLKEAIVVGKYFKITNTPFFKTEEHGIICKVISVFSDHFEYRQIINETGFEIDEEDDVDYSEDIIRSKITFFSFFFMKSVKELNADEKDILEKYIDRTKFIKEVTYSSSCYEALKWVAKTGNNNVAKYILNPKKTKTDFGDLVSITKDGFSFLPVNKESIINPDGTWNAKNRQIMKFAKLANKLLVNPRACSDADYEKFNNLVRAYIGMNGDDKMEGKYEFDIVVGEKLRKCYLESSYTKHLAQGNNLYSSCMRYEKCQPFLDLYALNPDNVSLLVMKDHDNLIAGRAVLWNAGDKIYMDRIYGSDSIITTFQQYAKDKGWYYKSEQSASSGFNCFGGQRILESKIDIPLKINPDKEFPYLDTLYFYDAMKQVLTNQINSSDPLVLEMRSQSGDMKFAKGNKERLAAHYANMGINLWEWTDAISGIKYPYNHPKVAIGYTFDKKIYEGVVSLHTTESDYNGERFLKIHIEYCPSRKLSFKKDDTNFVLVGTEWKYINDLTPEEKSLLQMPEKKSKRRKLDLEVEANKFSFTFDTGLTRMGTTAAATVTTTGGDTTTGF